MVAFNFKKMHEPKILSGEKFSTVRPKRRCKPGDMLQLYTGMRTRHVKLLKVTECLSVDEVTIFHDRVEGIEMELDEFLSMEGFGDKSFEEFVTFFHRQYGLPFTGYLVSWK